MIERKHESRNEFREFIEALNYERVDQRNVFVNANKEVCSFNLKSLNGLSKTEVAKNVYEDTQFAYVLDTATNMVKKYRVRGSTLYQKNVSSAGYKGYIMVLDERKVVEKFEYFPKVASN